MIPTSQTLDVKTRILQAKKSWTVVVTIPLAIGQLVIEASNGNNDTVMPGTDVMSDYWA